MCAAKGLSGFYTIRGKAFGPNNSELKNSLIIIKIGSEEKQLTTNDAASFEIKIPWSTACPSNISKKQKRELNHKNNPKYLVFKFNNSTIQLKNEWRKHSRTFQTAQVITKNLYFK
jgi:hypothetical protein